MRRSILRTTALTLGAAVALTACSSSGGRDGLVEALDTTFDGSFAWELAADADASAMSLLGELESVGLIVAGSSISGVTNDGQTELALTVAGTTFLEARSVGDDGIFFRAALAQIAPLLGLDIDPTAIQQALAPFDFSPEVLTGIQAAVASEWVGISGSFDSAGLAEVLGTGDDQADVNGDVSEVFGASAAEFFDKYMVIAAESERDGEVTYNIDFDLDAFVSALGSLQQDAEQALSEIETSDAALPLVIVERGGNIQSIAADLAEYVRRSGDEVTGEFLIVFELSQHGSVAAVEAPEGAVTVDGQELADAVTKLLAAFQGAA